MRPNKKNYKI